MCVVENPAKRGKKTYMREQALLERRKRLIHKVDMKFVVLDLRPKRKIKIGTLYNFS